MKVLFLLLCVVCSAAVSLLIFIMTTGIIPLRPPPESQPVGATAVSSNTAAASPEPGHAGARVDLAEDLLRELGREKEDLARRAGELDVRAERVRLEEATLEALRKDLADLKQALSSNLLEVAATERENLKRISEVCSKMDPASAAQMLVELPNEQAATILGMTNERAAAKIMDAAVASGTTGAKRAADWAEMLRRLRIGKDVPRESQT